MAVQFQCPACDQPIETEDEWAGKPVACPYCRKTVTAPEASTFLQPSGPPVATPLDVPAESTAAAWSPPAAQASANTMAVWAMVLACGAVVLFLAYNVLAAKWLLDLVGPNATPEEAQRVLMEQIQAGNMPPWVIAAVFLMLAVFGLWTAGLICGISALRKPTRRGLAVGSLAVCGVLLLLLCVGFALGAGGLGAGIWLFPVDSFRSGGRLPSVCGPSPALVSAL